MIKIFVIVDSMDFFTVTISLVGSRDIERVGSVVVRGGW